MDVLRARELVTKFLAEVSDGRSKDWSIIDGATRDLGSGWLFFYESNAFLDGGDFRDALAGNAPLVVLKRDGSVHSTGTAYPVEHYLDMLKKGGVL